MIRTIRQTLFKLIVCLIGAAVLAAGWIVCRSPDPTYAVYEIVYQGQFHRYDDLIADAAQRRGIDPMLLKAVIWRESRFRPEKVGGSGERGLMQVTDAAALEWAKAERIDSFVPTDLFDPKVNINAGSWLLARALGRYQGKDDPLPFALAEYNAGRSRVARWSNDSTDAAAGPGTDSRQLQENIDIGTTKRYVESVQGRIQFYHQRGRM